MPISKETKKRLIALGVPEERHDAAGLAALFPPEFKVTPESLSDAEIASVYLTFVDHGLINASLPILRPARHSHVCHFYRSDEEMLTVAAAYLEEGLRGGERCLWVPPTWITLERARASLRAVRPELELAEAAGRLLFFDDHEVHLRAGGAMADARSIIGFWLEQEQAALARGFRGLRIAGDGTALIRDESWKGCVDYERDCDAAFRGRRIAALCAYSVKEVPAERLARVLTSHGLGVHHSRDAAALRPGAGLLQALELLRQP